MSICKRDKQRSKSTRSVATKLCSTNLEGDSSKNVEDELTPGTDIDMDIPVVEPLDSGHESLAQAISPASFTIDLTSGSDIPVEYVIEEEVPTLFEESDSIV